MTIGDGSHAPNQRRHSSVADGVTVGFLTDPTLCIGCKACEVACKEWNGVPDDGQLFTGTSYDNTGGLGANSWRHVKFVELEGRGPAPARPARSPAATGQESSRELSWLFLSDVCKHCEEAGCLEACPTGAIVRTEIGSVLVQDDVCNGCGYCVVGCPFGVVDRRPAPPAPRGADSWPGAGGAFKCTFCYDRQVDGLTPACAKSCPTESILFGPLEDLRRRADKRVERLRDRGWDDVAVYDPRDTSVRGTHAIFIVPGEPSRFGLPAAPEVPTVHLRAAWTSAAWTGLGALLVTLLAFLAG